MNANQTQAVAAHGAWSEIRNHRIENTAPGTTTSFRNGPAVDDIAVDRQTKTFIFSGYRLQVASGS